VPDGLQNRYPARISDRVLCRFSFLTLRADSSGLKPVTFFIAPAPWRSVVCRPSFCKWQRGN
jgi:hypothetical protein